MRSRSMLLVPAAVLALLASAAWAGSSASAATSVNGLIAYNSYATADGDIYVVNPDGTGEQNVTGDQPEGEVFDDQGPDWSPDGTRIAFTRYSMNGCDIYLIDPDGTDLVPLVESGGSFEDHRCASQPDWSPDGSRFAFLSDLDGNLEIYVMNADGSDVTQVSHTAGATRNLNPQWSPDGARIAFASDRGGPGQDLYVMNADGSDPVNVTNTNSSDVWIWNPAWSPDGTRIAYTRVEDVRTGEDTVETRADIHITTLDGASDVNVTNSPEWESSPVFSPDGTQLSFVRYVDGQSDVWVVDVPPTAPAPTARAATETAARQVTFNGSAGQPDWQTVEGVDETAPKTTIGRPAPGAWYSAGRLARFTGTAVDEGSGVALVEVALRRRAADGTCKWWEGGRFVRTGSCRDAIWLRARGTLDWAYPLPAPLAATGGSYTLLSRATDGAGNVERTAERGRNANTIHVA